MAGLDFLLRLVYIEEMYKVDVNDAGARLRELLDRVEEGEKIAITKAGKPVARLVPVGVKAMERVPGTAKGKIVMAKDFDDPLPAQFAS